MQCPSCHKDVPLSEKQFGALYTCQKCQSVYFVNFDGVPEYGEIAPIEFMNENQISDSQTSENQVNETNEQPFQPFESTFEATTEQIPEEIKEENQAEGVSEVIPDKNPFDLIAREIETFGNQETEISGLTYDLKITGLDSKEAIFVLKEALLDVKFGWNSEEIFNQINYGSLELKQMTPVQAFVLAKRIQFIDAEMDWSQNVLA